MSQDHTKCYWHNTLGRVQKLKNAFQSWKLKENPLTTIPRRRGQHEVFVRLCVLKIYRWSPAYVMESIVLRVVKQIFIFP